MLASRPPFILAVLVLALSAACASNGGSTTSSTGAGGSGPGGTGNGTGNTNATGATGASATGGNAGSPTTGGTTGTTGKPPQDPIGTQCSKTGNAEFQSCSTSIDCACPLLCGLDATRGVDDAGGSICVAKCKSSADCPEIWTSCQNGLCTINICEADGGGGAFMGPCDAVGQGDGTCEPTTSEQEEVFGVCIQSGTVDVDGGNCDPNQQDLACATPGSCPFLPLPLGEENTKRPSASALCPIGFQCKATSATTGHCEQLCDPVFNQLSDNDAGGCLEGKDCVPIGPDTSYGGECIFQGDGGCAVGGGGAGELANCLQSKDCECPLECEVDVNSFRHVCETPCTETAGDGGCDMPYTSCQRGITGFKYCNYDYCVQTFFGQPMPWLPDAGTYGGKCDLAGHDDGLCQVEIATDPFGNPTNAYGLCGPSGTVPIGGACGNPPYCGVNELCASAGGAPAMCFQICDPLSDAGCPGGDGCFSVVPFPLSGMTNEQSLADQVAGVCVNPCSTPSTACVNSSECCDGFCAFALPDAGNGFCN